MGLKHGEQVDKIHVIEIVSNTPERLDAITAEDTKREGFPEMTPYYLPGVGKMNKSGLGTTADQLLQLIKSQVSDGIIPVRFGILVIHAESYMESDECSCTIYRMLDEEFEVFRDRLKKEQKREAVDEEEDFVPPDHKDLPCDRMVVITSYYGSYNKHKIEKVKPINKRKSR